MSLAIEGENISFGSMALAAARTYRTKRDGHI